MKWLWLKQGRVLRCVTFICKDKVSNEMSKSCSLRNNLSNLKIYNIL